MKTLKKGKQYRQYLASPAWRQKQQEAIERAGWACQLCCSTDDLHVHHRTYERLGRELPMDLTVLCARCHRVFHESTRLTHKQARKQRRQEIDDQIINAVKEAGLIAWSDIYKQLDTPRAQSWARCERLIKRRVLAWRRGKLCLYAKADLYPL